ncbi:MAG: Dockerin type 1 [uncultured bacterium (gcode 4)]|uniref:Dockerin type 1 n=1 Tax=uncultured bacterium (gcode 4) TaxID=1234023 RepID=K1YGS5_9BACT|nr:MAG: Dockerin type 1 [uncultured bacterium (gcode 4)]
MKLKLLISTLFVIAILSLGSKSEAYVFGMKSRDNSIENIQRIEKQYKLDLPIVSFIFDPRGPHVEKTLNALNTKLGEDRIYHISISPDSLSAQQVADGKFDKQYTQFFQDVKKNNLRVIFRTMHEMNGGRYPRSSNPTTFKKAWIHVRELARAEGLSQTNILFDMSVNARDLPAKGGKPAQTATFIQCQQKVKAKLKCPTFEDYYPGDKYVDLMGVTFYNRGKWNSNRRWGTPDQIVNAAGRKTLDRLKTFNKPIFVDEVGTTAVNYEWAYSFKKSLEVYANNSDLKNEWLLQLKDFLLRETRIVGAIYFNVDLSNGLKTRTLGELDRSVIDYQSNKFYDKILDIYAAGKPNDSNALYYLFNIKRVTLNDKTYFIPSDYAKPVKDLYAFTTKYVTGLSGQLDFLDKTKTSWSLRNQYKRFTKVNLDAIVDATKKFF